MIEKSSMHGCRTVSSGGLAWGYSRFIKRHHVPAPKGGNDWSRSDIGRILKDPGLKGDFYRDYECIESGAYRARTKRVPFERK